MHYIHCFTHCLPITAKGAYGHVSLTRFSLCCRVLTCLLCPSATPRSNPKGRWGAVHSNVTFAERICLSIFVFGGWVFGGSRTLPQGCIRREGTSEAAPEAVRQTVAAGCQSSWGRLLSATNAIEAGTCRQGDSGWALAGRPEGGAVPPLLPTQSGFMPNSPSNASLPPLPPIL